MAHQSNRTISHLFNNGYYTTYAELRKSLPVTRLALALGTNYNRMKKLLEEPENYPLKMYYRMSKCMGFDWEKLSAMVLKEADERLKSSKKKKTPR